MREKILLLLRSIEEDQLAIDRIFGELEDAALDSGTPVEERIVVGYRLHNLYNAFEHIFHSVARTFENSIDDAGGWHVEMLRRMRLDLSPLRPAVIDQEAFARLNELRGFRHVFRSLYGAELDPSRMGVALGKARELRAIWPEQIAAFSSFLEDLLSAEGREPSV